MFAILVFGLLAAASAAPNPSHRHSPFCDDSHETFGELTHPSFGEHIFDTRRFWADLESELQRDMEDMISSFRQRFPTSVSTAQVTGNQYKITIPLEGFEEKDVVVKAKGGVVMVQAVHNTGDKIMNSYTDVRTLPADVDADSGIWSYDKEVLTVIFTIKNAIAEPTETPTTELNTAFESREEMGKSDSDNQDADVGANDASSKEKSLITNEISDMDATTYAVDLKNEVEFVPVHYK